MGRVPAFQLVFFCSWLVLRSLAFCGLLVIYILTYGLTQNLLLLSIRLRHTTTTTDYYHETTSTTEESATTKLTMPLLRTLTTKIKTAISPSSSPTSSPTSPQVSSFEVVKGRKEGGTTIKRPETYPRTDSFMTDASSASKENADDAGKTVQRRMSRFREELDVGDE